MENNFSITNKTRVNIPSFPFIKLKNDILGIKYSLSLAFVSKEKSREINKKYRDKNKPTNILSFSLSPTEGEIIMCPAVIKAEVKNKIKNLNKTWREFFGFLVIHGMLHLKGMTHSSKMERAEGKYDKRYFYRNRRGLLNNQGGGRGIYKRRKKS